MNESAPDLTDEQSFAVRQTNVIPGGTWKLNQEIVIEFTQDIDFSTVSLSTIQIVDSQGVGAIGTFAAEGPRTVLFQPKCPSNEDNSDGGFGQGREYRLSIVSENAPGNGNGVTVQNTAGERLEAGVNVPFVTPESTNELALFVDTVAGPPDVQILQETDEVPTMAPEDSPFSYIEFGDGQVDYFRFNPADQEGQAESLAPLNLYSDTSQQFSIVLNFNQPIFASTTNVNNDLIRLQYLDGTTWDRVPAEVSLIANCTVAGASVRVSPTGIVPQNSELRVIVRAGFRDLTGDRIQAEQTSFAHFFTNLANPSIPGEEDDGSDEILERFTLGADSIGSLEDTSVASSQPRADWGNDRSPGAVSASFNFDGTGGANGSFDVTIPAGTSIFLNTDSDTITGEGGIVQPVINGVLDVRNLTVEQGGRLVFLGPNTATILATGSLQVDGLISVNGGDNFGVGTLNTTNQPEEGAAGQAGGGDGGVASVNQNSSTPAGNPGNGAFNLLGGGGGGGETGFAPLGGCAKENRRGAGGGGGNLGKPVRYLPVASDPADSLVICQMLIGMDGEEGFPASFDGLGAISQTMPAQGGYLAPSPFVDASPNNDFFGNMITAEGEQIRGELPSVWAGSGGGGGGDAAATNVFPRTPFSPAGDEKGSGGGGGAGGLLVLALGDVVLGPVGSITADGGQGGGGENVIFLDRIGGGSGGGSGGHIVISSARSIIVQSESQVVSTGPFYQDDTAQITGATHDRRPLRALGGQGGAGKDNMCGAETEGQTRWRADAIPFEAFEGRENEIPPFGPAIQNAFEDCNARATCADDETLPIGECFGAGGDGSPGIIQLHVADPDTQLVFGVDANTGYVSTGIDVTRSMVPPPLGWTSPTTTPDVLIPFFSARSESFSRWIPIGLARLNGGGSSNPVEFAFDGTDPATGSVNRSGTSPEELDSILEFTDISIGGATPSIDVASATVTVAANALLDPNNLYVRNPMLMREFAVRLRNGGAPGNELEFTVVSARSVAGSGEIALELDPRGSALASAISDLTGANNDLELEIVPFYFRFLTGGVPDLFPQNTDVKILFDATLERTLTGEPDPNASIAYSGRASAADNDLATLNGFATDIGALNSPVVVVDPTDPNSGAMTPLSDQTESVNWDFFRFKVEFDIAADGGDPTLTSPRPGVDFLRVPYRF